MSAFIVGEEQRKDLERLRQFAEEHRIGVDDLLDIFNGRESPVGDRKGYSCMIPVGYRVVFCIEHQKKGYARHLSVSMVPPKAHRCAHPEVIKELMGYLGFEGKLNGKDVMVYPEDGDTIINVIEYIKENKKPLEAKNYE